MRWAAHLMFAETKCRQRRALTTCDLMSGNTGNGEGRCAPSAGWQPEPAASWWRPKKRHRGLGTARQDNALARCEQASGGIAEYLPPII
jgi:hypothetical protein